MAKRFLAKLGRAKDRYVGSGPESRPAVSADDDQPGESELARPAVAAASEPVPAPEPIAEPTSLPGRLWMQAYDAVQADDQKLASAYELVLNAELGDASGVNGTTNGGQARSNMTQLVESGLKKKNKEFTTKHKLHEGLRVVSSVKEVVSTAIKSAPEASVVWAGVCVLLQVLETPLSEAAAHYEGISYVLSRMDWYWNLSNALLNTQAADSLQTELEKHIVNLYQSLLTYQMKSVCSFSRATAAVVWRDAFKVDNWTEAMITLKKTEQIVQQDIDMYNNLEMRQLLKDMAALAHDRNSQLQDIHQAIQDGAAKQIEAKHSEEDRKCLQELLLSDPRADKRRIVATKGGLFRGASNWVLEHDDFQQWRGEEARLLWIKGDPGKGKTMLLVTIVDELERELDRQTKALSYFFCQGTNNDLNNATAVLRGLIHQLASQHPQLLAILRKDYDNVGSKLFTDGNAFFSLSRILEAMFSVNSLTMIYLVIDALDECMENQEHLLQFIADHTSYSHVKWIVSSRNRPEIERYLQVDSEIRLSLEILQNAAQVSQAVNAYIDYKIRKLKCLQDDSGLRERVRDRLREKASGTYLWVALVTKELEKAKARLVMSIIEKAPTGLHDLYQAVMDQIRQDEDWELCQLVLSAATVAYRPLHLTELATVAGLPEEFNAGSVKDVVLTCNSFLTVLEDGFVYIIHQSAKDYLSRKTGEIFVDGPAEAHARVLRQSLRAMPSVLRRDIYNLRSPGFSVEDVTIPNPDGLHAVRYSCVYWVDHFRYTLNDENEAGSYDDMIVKFLRQFCLYWLEASSLLKQLGEVILSIVNLSGALQGRSAKTQLANVVEDLRRFVLENRWVIEHYPLQIYESALLFAPTNSIIRQMFLEERPKWIKLKWQAEANWSPCLQTLEAHSWLVHSIKFSPDGQLLASLGRDGTIGLWDVATGGLQHELRHNTGLLDSHNGQLTFSSSRILAKTQQNSETTVWDVVSGTLKRIITSDSEVPMTPRVSPDGKLLAAASHDHVQIWNVETGVLEYKFPATSPTFSCSAFSPDNVLFAVVNHDYVCIWNLETEELCRGISNAVEDIYQVEFSPDGALLACIGRTIRVWDTKTWSLKQIDEYRPTGFSFSPDGQRLAALVHYCGICIWGAQTTQLQHIIKCHGYLRYFMFSPDGKLVVLVFEDRCEAWSTSTWVLQHTMTGQSDVLDAAMSPNGSLFAAAFLNGTIKIWDLAAWPQTTADPVPVVTQAILSTDGRLLVTEDKNGKFSVWDADSGTLQGQMNCPYGEMSSITLSPDGRTLALIPFMIGNAMICDTSKRPLELVMLPECGNLPPTHMPTFSPDGLFVAFRAEQQAVLIYNAATQDVQHIWKTSAGVICCMEFSPDGTMLAIGDFDVMLFDTRTGSPTHTLRGHKFYDVKVLFSPDGHTLVTACQCNGLEIWNVSTGLLKHTIRPHQDPQGQYIPSVPLSMAFSLDGKLLAFRDHELYRRVIIWDVTIPAVQETLLLPYDVWTLAFHESNTSIVTEAGRFLLAHPGAASESPAVKKTTAFCFRLSADGTWLMRNDEKVLWLPPAYRPVHRHRMCISRAGISKFVHKSNERLVILEILEELEPGV